MTVKIFVGNLSSDTTSDDILPLFARFGPVTECDVLKNFGFVHMTNDDDANNAITELTGTLLKGSRMRVEKSTGGSRPGGGGRGGGGGGKMGRGAGRGGRGRGGSDLGGRPGRGDPPRSRDPYPPHPYYRPPPYDPYDPYDRYPPPPRDRLDERRLYALEAERRLLDERYPPAPRDRYLGRYPLDRYPYDDPRLPPDPREDLYARRAAALDRYGYMERPPPDYYARARRAEAEAGGYGDQDASNGYGGYGSSVGGSAADYMEKAQGVSAGAGAGNPQTFSSTYSSYYDRFYKSNGSGSQAQPKSIMPGAGGGSGAMAGGGASQYGQRAQSVPGKPKSNEQAFLQTGPIFF